MAVSLVNSRREVAIINMADYEVIKNANKREVGRPSASALRQISHQGVHMSEVRAHLAVDVDGNAAISAP